MLQAMHVLSYYVATGAGGCNPDDAKHTQQRHKFFVT